MRRFNTLLGTGCFFLCLGGWGYNVGANPADPASEVKAALQTAAADAAAAPADAPAAAPAPAIAQAPAEAKPAEVKAEPKAEPKAAEPTSTNLANSVVNVGADGSIDQFTVQDMDINTALHLLSLQAKRNIIASKDVKGAVTVNLYNVKFNEALEAILTPNGFGYVEKGNFLYVYTTKELEEIKKRDRKTVNRIFHLKYMTAADASVLIKPLLSTSGQMALTPAAVSGLPSSATETGGLGYATDDTLVINDFPENIAEVDKSLAQLDTRPKQVLVEATILRASLKEDNALGIDFVSLSGIDFSTLTNVFATNNTNGSGGSGGSGGSTSGTGGITNPGVLAGKTVANGASQTNVGTDFASKVPSGGLSVGFLSNNISIFLRALEEITDTTVVANPKILALNKHRGEVFIGDQFGYKTTSTTTTNTQETVNFLDSGTKLVFRPFVADDGYVRMEIHPEDSTGRLNAASLPEKSSTEVTSNLMIKDGRTVVIGGLFREQTTAGRGQVPVLGNIPVLGVPFRRTNDSTNRTETVVLITPHIVNDDTALYEESLKQQEDVTRAMLGNRAGLQPWGRDRLAQTWYAKAQESLDKGDREKALMYTDWALNTNPRFLEATKLRENLTSRKMQEADESSIHDFVRRVIQSEKAATQPK